MELVGFIMPLFIDAVNRYVPNSKLRLLVSVLMCVVAGILVNADKIKFADPIEIMGSMSMIFASSQIMYQALYKDSKVQEMVRGEKSS